MQKTLILAAALMSLGMGAAFAGDGDVTAANPPPSARAAWSGKPSGQATLFSTATPHHETWVYDQFGYAGAQGGRN